MPSMAFGAVMFMADLHKLVDDLQYMAQVPRWFETYNSFNSVTFRGSTHESQPPEGADLFHPGIDFIFLVFLFINLIDV